jgi:hypothetical protein
MSLFVDIPKFTCLSSCHIQPLRIYAALGRYCQVCSCVIAPFKIRLIYFLQCCFPLVDFKRVLHNLSIRHAPVNKETMAAGRNHVIQHQRILKSSKFLMDSISSGMIAHGNILSMQDVRVKGDYRFQIARM